MFRLNHSCLALLPLALACGTDVGGSPSLPGAGTGGSTAGAGGSDAGAAGRTGGQPEGGTSGASGSAGEGPAGDGGNAGIAGDGGTGGDTGGSAGAAGTAGTTGGTAGSAGVGGGTAGAPTELVVEEWGSPETELVHDIVVGDAGAVIVVGNTYGDMPQAGTGSSDSDIFVSRRNRGGVGNWTQQLDGGSNASATGAVGGSDGKIYVTGYASALSPGDSIIHGPFLSRWNWDGELEKTWRWGSDRADEAWGIARDGSILYAVGYTHGELGPSGKHGGRDGFLTKLDEQTGSPIWSRQWGDDSGQSDDLWTRAWAVAVDGAGGIYVVGETEAELEAGEFAGSRDAFLVKYNADGVLQWLRQWGSGGNDGAMSVAVDVSGDVWVVGYAYGPLGRIGAGSAMIAKFSPDGDELWIEQWGATWANDVLLTPDGRALVSGQAGDVDGEIEAGKGDIFLSFWTETAESRTRTTRLLGTDLGDYPQAIELDGAGTILVAGETRGAFPGFSMKGQSDAFLLRVPPN